MAISSSCNWVFDVFPSFSGEDVRRTFLSHLLLSLDHKLITCFKDNEIERSQSIGLKLVHAIRDSRIAIVVFSKTYASSTWCLNELLEIVKCKEDKGQIVIPVFYGLDPSHVRKQTGEFGETFQMICKNRSDELPDLWKGALTHVANIHGYHSDNWSNEAHLIEDITNDVLGRLVSLTPSMEFADFAGIEDHIAKMSVLLQLESEEARMVGIWGPVGIGKTTIARALFGRISRHFQSSIFIDRAFVSKTMEIFRTANPDDYNMKLRLQESFLSEILNKKDIKIHHLGVVGERLKHKRVLVVLDDLSDQLVLDSLVGGTQWFGCWSRILVVTKDKHVLRAHGIDRIYEVAVPSDELALDMFCTYAFRENSQRDGFNELASEVAKFAGNLPLALNVLGLYLRGRDKEDWLDMLPRLRKGPDGKILKALRVSYDGLGCKEDKALFRHIACLFNGMEANDIKMLLADSGLDVNIGLKNLIDNSLIHERGSCVHTHCLVQEMGKEIVRTQSNKPREREFLVDSKDVCDLFSGNSDSKKVIGISLNLEELYELLRIDKKAFRRLRNLRFLRIYKDSLDLHKQIRLHLPGGLNYLSPKLKLLCWDGFPLPCLPSSFHAEHLIVLRMRSSKLEKLWEEVEVNYQWRTYVDKWGVKTCTRTRTCILGCVTSSFVFVQSPTCPEDPDSVLMLNELYMNDCESLLTVLPTGINLESLYRLDLSGSSRFRSFPYISTNISFLILNQTDIKEVPWWIENFSRLVCLEMWECKRLNYISPNISKLKLLEKLPALSFINCFKLDQEALIQQSVFKYLILPGGKVPSHFTNQATGSSLVIRLLQSSLSKQLLGFRACLVVDANEPKSKISSWIISCHFTGKDRSSFRSSDCQLDIELPRQMDNHLVIFDCCFPLNEDNDSLAELNYDPVDVEIKFTGDSRCEIKGCGVQLSEVCFSDEQLSNFCEADKSNMVTAEEFGKSSAEARRSGKRLRVTGKTIQESTDMRCSQTVKERWMYV
ncbi:BnaC01g39050D [Brassica napus]|uniref:ADP-ribosyl cyclase/cyclic ADP-ribose hydrolase n=1 Tax=Brassica napus TaxID=3708 RepID=A0A078G9X4_BRANA|nr:BnaC01g39050D [Brassica napus]